MNKFLRIFIGLSVTFIFIIFHLIAIFTAAWLLIITIPLHIIVAMMGGNRSTMEKQTKLLEEQNELLRREKDKRL